MFEVRRQDGVTTNHEFLWYACMEQKENSGSVVTEWTPGTKDRRVISPEECEREIRKHQDALPK